MTDNGSKVYDSFIQPESWFWARLDFFGKASRRSKMMQNFFAQPRRGIEMKKNRNHMNALLSTVAMACVSRRYMRNLLVAKARKTLPK